MRITQSFAGAPGITRYPFDKKILFFVGVSLKKPRGSLCLWQGLQKTQSPI
jgi:hypothetical protein